MIKYEIGSASLIGGRAENQDCFQFSETEYGLLAVVCDGMGGPKGGKIAAEMAVKKVFECLQITKKDNPRNKITTAITHANSYIFQFSRSEHGFYGMGTTITALLINENYAMSFHAGDSRIYHFRKGNILFRTFDHSQVFEMVRLGILSEEEARVSPLSNIITRALGTGDKVEVSVSDQLSYQKGDRFFLCTDGIWGVIPEIQLTRMVSIGKPLTEVITHLINYIDETGNEKGGMHDNMTGVVIEMQNNSLSTAIINR